MTEGEIYSKYVKISNFMEDMFFTISPNLFSYLHSSFFDSLLPTNGRKNMEIILQSTDDDYKKYKEEEEKVIHKATNNLNMLISMADVDLVYVTLSRVDCTLIPIQWSDYIFRHEEFLMHEGQLRPNGDIPDCLLKYRKMDPTNLKKILCISRNAYKYINQNIEDSYILQTEVGAAFWSIRHQISNKNISIEDLLKMSFKVFGNTFDNLENLSKEDSISLWRLFAGGGAKK